MAATHSIEAHAHRWLVPLAVVTAVAMLAGWFPLMTLWHQQTQINAAAAQLSVVKQQEQALTLEAKSTATRAAATMLAREQYQLVAPGQSLIQVLPGDVTGKANPDSGDPGLQPLVSPASVSRPDVTAKAPAHSGSGFFSRLVRTLEFWR